jgi:hypothetical protein
MAERRKTNSSNITSFGNSQVQRIHSDIHRIMDSREYDFYELEPVEVKEVLLDKNKLPKKSNGKPNYKYYGAIKGSWINNKDQQILGDGVHILPLDSQIKRYPVVGENVVCVNYFGQTYYSDIINIKNNPNNNVKTGLSDRINTKVSIQTTDEDFKYQRNIDPSVQIVAGHNTEGLEINEPVKHNLNKDDASIYVQAKGGSQEVKNPNPELSDIYTKGSVIVLDADYIVLNAKQVLRQQSGELNEVIGKNVEIKHNQTDGVVFTGETKKLLDNLRNGPIEAIKREIEECIEEIRKLSNVPQREFEELKQLQQKLNNIKIDPRKTLAKITSFRPSLKNDEFIKLENEYKNAQKALEQATPKAATDPVGFGIALGRLTNVISKFARGDFLRFDIITD